MTTTDEIKTIKAAKDAATKLTTIEHGLRDRHTALTEARRRTFHARRSRQEVVANTTDLVTAAHGRWWDDHRDAWATALSGRRELKVSGLGTDHERERVVTVPPRLPSVHSLINAPGALTLHDLCGLAPALVIASITEALTALPDDAFGLPDVQRTERLTALEAEIADVEARHTELVDAAAEVGIDLKLLPTVQARREEQARHEERERLRAAARAAS